MDESFVALILQHEELHLLDQRVLSTSLEYVHC